jgi:serine/threonine protein kinase
MAARAEAERSVIDDDTLPGSCGLVNVSCIRGGTITDGRYRLLERVGSGGTAAVYQARDLLLGGEVAVKILDEVFAADECRAALFRHEAHIAERLRHTNIVRTLGHHIVGEMHYIVMEHVRGPSVKALVANVAPLVSTRDRDHAPDTGSDPVHSRTRSYSL